MKSRPQERRPKDFKPGRVTGWRAGVDRAALARRVRYVPDGKHKDYPSPDGEWTLCTRPEGTRCPQIERRHWPRLRDILRTAAEAGIVQFQEGDASEFPARVWAFIDGKLFEARRSNAESGIYHGFPLDHEQHYPKDPHGLLSTAPREEL